MADVTLDLRLNSQSFLADIANARAQAGMMLGGQAAPGFGAQAQAAFSMMAGGATTGLSQMAGQFAHSPLQRSMGFGEGYSSTGMALDPNYGQVHAYTTKAMEQSVLERGLFMAERLKPPGVSAESFALSVESNAIERDLEGRRAAQVAFRSTGLASAAGMVAGGFAGSAFAKIGAKIGGRVGLAGPAGFAAAWFGGMEVWDRVSSPIEEHFAEAERIGQYTAELGEIAGAGRDLSRSERYGLGVAARKAAFGSGIDVNQMGDILAGAGAMGMMPDATDPQKARRQYRDLADVVKEGAELLGSSLADAQAVIKRAVDQGMTAREGLIRASGGGMTGRPSFASRAHMGMAASPMGRMQLMAATSGEALGGPMDLPGQALAGMSQGGDMMSNLGTFMVHEDQIRKQIGPGGRRTMARQALESGGEFVQQFAPDMTDRDAQALYAMRQYGMSGAQARKLVSGTFAPRSYMRESREAFAAQEMGVSNYVGALPSYEDKGSIWNYMGTGAQIGGSVGMFGGLPWMAAGAAVGAAGGAIAYAGGGEHPDLFADKDERADFYQQRMRREMDRRTNRAKSALGIVESSVEDMNSYLSGNVTVDEFSFSGSKGAASRAQAMMTASGIHPTAPGPGTIAIAGQYYDAREYQKAARRAPYRKGRVSKKQQTAAGMALMEVLGEDDGAVLLNRYYQNRMRMEDVPTAGEDVDPEAATRTAALARRDYQRIADISPEAAKILETDAGLLVASRALGVPITAADTRVLRRIGGSALEGTREAVTARRGAYFLENYGEAFAREEPPEMRMLRKAEGALTVLGLKSKLPDRPENEMTEATEAYFKSSDYRKFARLASQGRMGAAKRAWQEGTARHGANQLFNIDPMASPGMQDASDAELAKLGLDKASLRTESPADMAAREHRMSRRLRLKGGGGSAREQAIGWGAQEEAMSTINKTLRTTHQMFKTLNKQVQDLKEGS